MKLEVLSMLRLEAFVEFRHLASAETKYVNDANELIAEELIYKFTTFKNREAYLLMDGDKVIGNLFLVYKSDNQELYIDLIALLKAYHGTSAAGLLMDKVFEIAKRNHCKQISLVVRNDNDRAMRFYTRYGFIYQEQFDAQRLTYVCPLKPTGVPPIFINW